MFLALAPCKREYPNGFCDAGALAMSVRHFERYVQANVPCVYCGQLTLYRLRDLERWADSRASPRVR